MMNLAQVRGAIEGKEGEPAATKLQQLRGYNSYNREQRLNKSIKLNSLNGELCGVVSGEEAEAQIRGGIRTRRLRVPGLRVVGCAMGTAASRGLRFLHRPKSRFWGR